MPSKYLHTTTPVGTLSEFSVMMICQGGLIRTTNNDLLEHKDEIYNYLLEALYLMTQE